MKKSLLTLSLLIPIAFAVKAQSGKQFSLGVDAGFSIPFNTVNNNYGNARTYYQDGFSTNLSAELPLSSSLHLVGSAGFAYYPSQVRYNMHANYPSGVIPAIYLMDTQGISYAFVPLKGGLKWYFTKNLYLQGDAGTAIGVRLTSTSSFLYSGEAGVVLPLSTRSSLDFGFGYQNGFKIGEFPFAMSQFGLRVGYRFGW